MKTIEIPCKLYKLHYFNKDYSPSLFDCINQQVIIKAKNGYFICSVKQDFYFNRVFLHIISDNIFCTLMKKSLEE